jgi:sec-independent protein translocase protein TatC
MPKLADTITGARVLGAKIAASQRRSNPEGRMPLMEHLRELRSRLIKAFAALAVGMAIGFIPQVYDRIWTFVYRPFKVAEGTHGGGHLIVIGVFDGFMLRVQIAFFFGLIITSPFWLYQLWAFIAPGLYRREKKWAYMFVGAAAPLFAAGAALAYWVMSRGLHYLLALVPNGVSVMATVTNYLSYFEAMILGFGLAFELPLALVLLNMVGIITHDRMRKWRRVMIFSVFVFAGIASPSPDPATMLLLAGPCVVLVEAAEVIIWANDRRRARRPSMYEGIGDDELSPLDLDLSPGDGADAGPSAGPDA